MNVTTFGIMLWVAVIFPLLLAIPALHSRLPWPRYIAIIPAIIVTLLPGEFFLALPWIIFESELAINGEMRWILTMTVMIWLIAATSTAFSKNDISNDRTATTFFLLTLAGNMGTVLANDLVAFFCFSTLMGYGFYGMLIQNSNAETHRAARYYLWCLIAADLLLFEALLLAGFENNGLHFEIVPTTMAEASSSLYLWAVFIGFALKAGIWPAHLWLCTAFKSPNLLPVLLLSGVPVAMALLGAKRWLPFGESAFFDSGILILMLGMVAMLYALLKFATHLSSKLMLLAWITILMTGLFVTALGYGLAYPSEWVRYQHYLQPFIVIFVVCLTTATLIFARSHAVPQISSLELQSKSKLNLNIIKIQHWVNNKYLQLKLSSRTSWVKTAKRYQRILFWQKPFELTIGWSGRITMLVVLGLSLAWLAS